MSPHRSGRGRRLSPAALIAAGTLLAARAPAQTCPTTVGPVTADFHASVPLNYNQIWSQAARGPNGWALGYSADDIYVRFFDLNLQPQSPFDVLVNATLNLDTQDEPAICYSAIGYLMAAWSDRHGYDGEQMGVYARIYNASRVPGPEFQISEAWQTSQWRPLIAPMPFGGWCVAWSGQWDGDAFFRLFGPTGVPITGDILINTYLFDAQVDPAPAVSPAGVIFLAFVDYSSHGTVGSGTNLYGRMYTSGGIPIQTPEFALTSPTLGNGDQRDPRVAADGQGRFVVVWEDEVHDGSGWGIYARRYDSAGMALGPEFLVPSTTAGNQHAARVAADNAGGFLVTWSDYSAGPANGRIRARRFDANAVALGPDFVVNESPANGAALGNPAMDSTGSDILIAYDGPGDPLNTLSGWDVYARRFAARSGPFAYCTGKTSSAGCVPSIGWSGSPSASSATPFTITASSVVNQKFGFLLYGHTSSFAPFQAATLCVAQPFRRTPAQPTGGTATGNNCTGSMSFDFDAWMQSGADPSLVLGTTISAQYYYRDTLDPTGFGSGLSNGLRFAICQ